MKTSKRLLSLFLAVVMALTACSVGFVAFAQEVNPKDNPAFNDKNASKEGSVVALNELVNEFLPDILKLVGEQTLANVGVSIDKVANAKFDGNEIKSDRFYELMLELSPALNKMLGGASRASVLTDTGFTWGYDVLDSRFYACLENSNATIDFWTLYDLCSKNADEHGNEFQKMCYDYLNGYTKDGKDVMGLNERLENIFNISISVDATQAFAVLDEIVANLQLDPNKSYKIEEIKKAISDYENANGKIENDALPTAFKMIEYYVSLAGLDVKVNDLSTALLYYNLFNTATLAGVLNRFANDGNADLSSLGIQGKLDFTNWEQQLRTVEGKKDLPLSELAEYYLSIFYDGASFTAEYSANILDGMTKYYGNTVTEEDIQNALGAVSELLMYDALAYALDDEFAKFAYDQNDYPFDNKYMIETVNGKINEYAKMIENLGAVLPVPNINSIIDGVLSNLTRTAGPNGEKLSTKYIADYLTDVYINLAKDPVSTISNLVPLITILVDEVILPLVFNQNGDAFGEDQLINIDTIYKIVVSKLPEETAEKLKALGINSLCLNLNTIVPDVLSYIQNKDGFEPAKGYYKKLVTTDKRKVPVIFNIEALDKLIAEHLYNYNFVKEITQSQSISEEYKPVIDEAIRYVIPLLDKAVDTYLNGNSDLGIEAHKDDATISKDMLGGLLNVTMGRGLNNISIALPTILDILGKMIVAEQNIQSNWEFGNRVVYVDKYYIPNLVGKYLKVENNTVLALKNFAFSKDPDPSNVTGWIVEFVLSTLGNSIIDLFGDIFTADPEKANEITKSIPIINELINSLGGFTDSSVLTDVLNGVFGLTRESKFSFTFGERAVPYATNDATYMGLSEDSVYYLIANVARLIRSIMDIVEANKATTTTAAVTPLAKNGEQTEAFEVKIPSDFSSVLTDANKAVSEELITKLDEVLSTLLANTDIDGFTADNATGVLSAAVTFLINHIGKDSTDKLLNLVQKYLLVINAANTTTDTEGSKNANSDGTVNVKKVYSKENLSTIVTETYALIEDIVNTMLPTVVKGDEYGMVTGAVNGIIAPGAVVTRSDSLNKKLLGYVSWNDVKGSKYANDLGYNFSAGDSQAFLENLYDSLGVIPAVIGTLFCTTGYYDNVFAPIFNTINAACGINPLASAKNGEEVLLALTNSVADFLNKLLDEPAATLLSLVRGITGVLSDKTLKPIIIKVVDPLGKEILGLVKFISKICPSLMNVPFGTIPIPGLGTLPLSIATIVLAIDMLPGIINSHQFDNIAVLAINAIAKGAFTLPANMPWDTFAKASNEELLLMIYAIAYENGLNDIINSAVEPILGTTFDAAAVLTAVQAVLSLTSPTEVYWMFDNYIGKATSKFSFPEGITQADSDKAIKQLDSIATNVFPLLKQFGIVNQNSLPELLSGMLYTNGTLTSIAKAVYGALESAIPMFTPAVVASYLTDSSFGTTYSAAAKSLNNTAKWADVSSLNWGFSDGSAKAQQGFINGLAAIFRPFNDILSVLLAEGNFGITSIIEEIALKDLSQEGETANGLKYTITIKSGILTVTLVNKPVTNQKNTITVDLNKAIAALGEISVCGGNGYESAIVPLLEAFMCEDVKTYSEYVKDYNKTKDALLTNILNPLFGFVNKLASAPFDTLTAVLPNIAYFIDNNGVAQMIDNLLSPITKTALPALKEAGIDVDQLIIKALGTDLGSYVAKLLDVNVKLDITLSDLTNCNIHEIVLPLINKVLANNNINITLPAFDWATIASHGKQTTVPSAAKNSDGKYSTIRIVANQGETLVAVLRYISQTLISNSTAIKNIISSIDGVKNNKTILDVLNCVFSQIKTAHKDDIVRAIFYFLLQEPQNRFFDYRNFKFKEYEFSYPETLDMEFLNVMAPMVDGILTGVLGQFVPGGLPGLVTGNIYKDDIINAVLGIYREIEKVNIDKNTKLIDLLAMSDLDFTTAHFAQLLTDKSYGKSYDSVAKAVANAGSWSKVGNLSWGVTDRDSFVHALSAALRPMYGVLDVLLNDGALGLFDLVYIPGTDGYTSTMVPIMEAFGLYNIKTQYQYREDMSKEYDAILLDILNPLLDKVEDILNAPIQMLTDILPNLALFFANDGLLQVIENLMTPVTALLKTLEPIVNVNDVLKTLGVDVSKELAKLGITGVKFDVYDLTATLKPVIGAENIVGVLNGVLKKNGIAIELMQIDWYQLASHGTLVSDQASQAATFGPRMFVESERNETLVAILRYLINTVNYKDNFNIISNLVTGMLGSADASISDVVNQVLGMLQGETDVVLSDLCGLLQTFA